MVDLLRRLAALTRAHLNDFLAAYRGGGHQRPAWDSQADFKTQTPPRDAYDASSSSGRPHRTNGLPYSDALASHYRVLDLPFGAPMDRVAKRWKDYLKKCHPDRYASDPQKQAEATELTQELTRAYESIRAAWKQYCP